MCGIIERQGWADVALVVVGHAACFQQGLVLSQPLQQVDTELLIVCQLKVLPEKVNLVVTCRKVSGLFRTRHGPRSGKHLRG